MPEDPTTVAAPNNGSMVVGLIPARWGSTRFPGKPLHNIAGRPLLQHVWQRCQQAAELDLVAVATDDEQIRAAAAAFGARVIMTRADHPSGTDRCAEAAASLTGEGVTHVINIQGDEPLIDPSLIDQLAAFLRQRPDVAMVTAACPLTDPVEIASEHVVKLVRDHQGRALYFSRSPIPFHRRAAGPVATGEGTAVPYLRHLGIYGYRLDILRKLVELAPDPLELAESLEQLRALGAGIPIHVILTGHSSPGIDTPEQAAALEREIQLAQGHDPASIMQDQ